MNNLHLVTKDDLNYGTAITVGKESVYNFKDAFESIEQVNLLLDGLKEEGIKPIFKSIIDSNKKRGTILFPKDMVGKYCFLVSDNLADYLNFFKIKITKLLNEN